MSLLLSCLACLALQDGPPPEPGLEKLDAALLERLAVAARDEFVRVDLVLREQASPARVRGLQGAPDKALRRRLVVASLQRVAAASQPALVGFLEAARAEGKVRGEIRRLWIHNVVSVEVTPAFARELARRPDVARLHHDPPRGTEVLEGALPAPSGGAATCGVEQIRAPEVWSELGITGRGVVVGVIDSGLCVTHSDLGERVWKNPREAAGNGIDDDRNGFVDDLHGWNFEDGDEDISDFSGHGSHVAGTIVGTGRAGTRCGVAPGAQVMMLRFFTDFAGEVSVWQCIEYGLANDADVLSGSLGWPHRLHPERATWRAVCENAIAAGAVVLFAAGNDSCGTELNNVRTPGDVPDVITVGAADCNDDFTFFSSCGPVSWQRIEPYLDHPYPPGLTKPDVSASGLLVVSHWLCAGYVTNTGTSMATPHVAGLAALLLQADPTLDQLGVKALLEGTAIDLGEPGKDNQFGAGRIDAFAAVQQALRNATPRRR